MCIRDSYLSGMLAAVYGLLGACAACRGLIWHGRKGRRRVFCPACSRPRERARRRREEDRELPGAPRHKPKEISLSGPITVAALATLAVTAKGLAGRIGGADSAVARTIVWWAELLGAVCVLGFGLLLLVASL